MADDEETTAVAEEVELGEYGLHIRLERGMQSTLKKAAELAYHMGDIQKPDLVQLMNLFIGWGLSIQKQKWLTRMGYK